MNRRDEVEALTERFRQAGARNPRTWAESQVDERIPQLARFLFLRQAWAEIVSETDPSWIHAAVAGAEAKPDDPYAGVGHAAKALLAAGATESQLTDLVRGQQAALLFRLCYLLEDPSLEDAFEDVQWGLFVLDEHGQPQEPLGGLHESVLETDPTGTEMRPGRGAG